MPKGKPIIQPDFQAIFFDYFDNKPRRQHYELRFRTSNLHHDAIFFASLIHDALFSRSSVQHRKNKVSIIIERDTWEVGTLVREGAPELHYCKSELQIKGVRSIEWRFTGAVAAENDELWIHYFTLTHSKQQADFYEVVIGGVNWKLIFVLEEDHASIILRDKGLPISHAVTPEMTERTHR